MVYITQVFQTLYLRQPNIHKGITAQICTITSMHIGVARGCLPTYSCDHHIPKIQEPPPPPCGRSCMHSSLLTKRRCTLAFQKQTYTLSVKGHIRIFIIHNPGEKRTAFTKPTHLAFGQPFCNFLFQKHLSTGGRECTVGQIILSRVLDLLHCQHSCNKRMVRDLTAPPLL